MKMYIPKRNGGKWCSEVLLGTSEHHFANPSPSSWPWAFFAWPWGLRARLSIDLVFSHCFGGKGVHGFLPGNGRFPAFLTSPPALGRDLFLYVRSTMHDACRICMHVIHIHAQIFVGIRRGTVVAVSVIVIVAACLPTKLAGLLGGWILACIDACLPACLGAC